MRYEINVARHGKHFFATHERSITSQEELIPVLIAFSKAFRQADGYEITVTRRTTTSEEINWVDLL